MSSALGTLVDRLFALRAERSALAERSTEIEKELKRIEIDVVSSMELAGLDRLSTGAGTVTPSESVHPQVEDWDAFLDWVKQDPERRVYLFRRVNGGPFREALKSTGQVPPGLGAFVERKLNYRSQNVGGKT